MFQVQLPWPLASLRAPIVDWLPAYKWREWLLNDIIAGLTVFVFLIPQGMAYALLAGVPPVYGLYSAIVPVYIYACLGTSRHLSVGPMAITSLLLSVEVQAFGYEEQSAQYVSIVMKLSVVVGVVIFVLGMFQLGTFVNLISESVLVGFLTASAMVIFVNQLKYVFGIHIPRFDYTIQTVVYYLSHLGEANVNACGVGLATFGALYAVRQWKKHNKPTPERLKDPTFRVLDAVSKLANVLCITAGSLIAYALSANELKIDIVGTVPSGLRPPSYVPVAFQEFVGFIPSALAIAFVAFAGNWAVSKKFAAEKGYEVSATQELIGHGFSVIVGTFFNSFAGSGGLARSAVNAEAGAQTQVSNIVAATLILFSVQYLTPLFYYIPMSVLGAVIQVSVLSMIDFDAMLKAYRTHHQKDCLVMVVTFVFTFFIGVSQGLVAGISISIGLITYSSAFPQIATLGRIPDGSGEGGYYKNVQRFPSAVQHPGVAILRMDGTLFFANCSYFKDAALQAAAGEFHTSKELIGKLIVDASCWTDIDLSGAQTLAELKQALDKMGVTLALVNVKANVRDRLMECNFAEGSVCTYYYFSIRDALDDVDHAHPTYTGEVTPIRCTSPLQGGASSARGSPNAAVRATLRGAANALKSMRPSEAPQSPPSLTATTTKRLPLHPAPPGVLGETGAVLGSSAVSTARSASSERSAIAPSRTPNFLDSDSTLEILRQRFRPVPTEEEGSSFVDDAGSDVASPLHQRLSPI
jgi:SulP family sulfate permease